MAESHLQTDLRRCLNRATFGVSSTLLAEAQGKGWQRWVEEQLHPDDKADAACAQRLKDLRLKIEYEFEPPTPEGGETKMMKGKGKQKVSEMRPLASLDQPIEKIFPLNGEAGIAYEEKNRPAEEVMVATLLRAVYSKWQVREVMVDFWHNHFSVNSGKDESIALALASYDRMIRANALGNFRTMLGGVAQSAAMLYYLDGVASKASPANENFARELFELHTFGARHYLNHLHTRWRDVPGALDGRPAGYIDQDVYEAARAFTGWTVENGEDQDEGAKRPRTGRFMLQETWHDPYQKRVLATEFDPQRPALEDGMRVLDLVARHPATAQHLAEKLCRRLVSDDPPESLIDKAAAEFTAGLDAPDQIARVVKTILLSDEYAIAPATKFKRPLEFLASYLRATDAEFTPRMDVVNQLDQMGQLLFRWTTPTGHPDTAGYWQGGTFLLRRWNLPLILRDKEWKGVATFHFLTRTPPECRTTGQVLDHWSQKVLGQAAPGKIRSQLAQVLADNDAASDMDEFRGDDNDRDENIAACVALLAATPEFQYR